MAKHNRSDVIFNEACWSNVSVLCLRTVLPRESLITTRPFDIISYNGEVTMTTTIRTPTDELHPSGQILNVSPPGIKVTYLFKSSSLLSFPQLFSPRRPLICYQETGPVPLTIHQSWGGGALPVGVTWQHTHLQVIIQPKAVNTGKP